MNLTQLQVGQKAIVCGFNTAIRSYRQKLLAMGLTPGVCLELFRFAPLGDPLEIRVRGYALSLRKAECQTIEVELI